MGRLEPKKRQLSSATLLKEEIVQLQKELEGQTLVRSALEKALNHRPLIDDSTYKSLSKPAENLIKEIVLLELEVVCLEKYLLSMYRTSFSKRLSPLPKTDAQTPTWRSVEVGKTSLESVNEDSVNPCNELLGSDVLADTGIYRSHSSLSHSAASFRASPPYGAIAEAIDSYHSLPLSMLEHTSEDANEAEEPRCGFRETPNWISEEMIRCISTIYCHLCDPPLYEKGEESTSGQNYPLHVEASKEHSGSFYTMVQVCSITRDSQRLNSVQELLHKYRCIISKLAQVDPGRLNHEEKLAFWINVHNALVMHVFIVYGVPRGSLKRISLVLKAAYDVGGHTISVDTIQSSILRCRLPRPTQWLQALFFPKTKFKARDPRKSYALKRQEARLHFSLCSGCRSDPTVRLYTAKRVHQELEMAKEEYIQMSIKVHKEQKRLVVPKNVECFIKEMGLSPLGTAEMLEHSMPHHQRGKVWRKVDFAPHDFSFRFLLCHELIR
ncbi:hypothetical protein AAHA92_06400 [Salvia divinorum]|uniref:Electron transporter n=1 Tax=Salvia divinorum TaxID=28513 RepID=A0ABD1I6J4_SALDI